MSATDNVFAGLDRDAELPRRRVGFSLDRTNHELGERRFRGEELADADRATLAERVGDVWVGPLESYPCEEHPSRSITHRWVWTVGASIEDADVRLVSGCLDCAAAEDEDINQ